MIAQILNREVQLSDEALDWPFNAVLQVEDVKSEWRKLLTVIN